MKTRDTSNPQYAAHRRANVAGASMIII